MAGGRVRDLIADQRDRFEIRILRMWSSELRHVYSSIFMKKCNKKPRLGYGSLDTSCLPRDEIGYWFSLRAIHSPDQTNIANTGHQLVPMTYLNGLAPYFRSRMVLRPCTTTITTTTDMAHLLTDQFGAEKCEQIELIGNFMPNKISTMVDGELLTSMQ